MASRSRGALPTSMIDAQFPFQVMLNHDVPERWKRVDAVMKAKYELGAYALGFSVYYGEEKTYYQIYCFPTREAAETFAKMFGGEFITPADRKKANLRPRSALPVVRGW